MPLERYGHSLGVLQPAWSAGKFYSDLLLWPYSMGMNPPLEPVYTLGYDRPGDRVPRLWYQFPISAQGALAEGAAWTLLPVILP